MAADPSPHETSAVLSEGDSHRLDETFGSAGSQADEPSPPHTSELAAARIVQLLRQKDEQIAWLTAALKSEEQEREAAQRAKASAVEQFHGLLRENEALQTRIAAAAAKEESIETERERLYAGVRDASAAQVQLRTLQQQNDDLKAELERQRAAADAAVSARRDAEAQLRTMTNECDAAKEELHDRVEKDRAASSDFRQHAQELNGVAHQARTQLTNALTQAEASQKAAAAAREAQEAAEEAKTAALAKADDLADRLAAAEAARTSLESAQATLNEENEALTRRLETALSDNASVLSRLRDAETSVAELQRTTDAARESDESVRAELSHTSSERSQLAAERDHLTQKVAQLAEEVANNREECARLSHHLDRLRGERDEVKNRLRGSEESLRRVHGTMDGAAQDYEDAARRLQETEEALALATAATDQARAERFAAAAERDELASQLREASARAAQVQRDMADVCDLRVREMQTTVDGVEAQLATVAAARDDALAMVSARDETVRSLAREQHQMLKEIDAQQGQLETRTKSLRDARTEGERLREYADSHRQLRDEAAKLRQQVKQEASDHKATQGRLKDAESRAHRFVPAVKERFEAMEKRCDAAKAAVLAAVRAVQRDADANRRNDVAEQGRLLETLRAREATIASLQEQIVDAKTAKAGASRQLSIEKNAREVAQQRAHKAVDEAAELKGAVERLKGQSRASHEAARVHDEASRDVISAVAADAARDVLAVLDAIADASERTVKPFLARHAALTDDLVSCLLQLDRAASAEESTNTSRVASDAAVEATRVERAAASLLLPSEPPDAGPSGFAHDLSGVSPNDTTLLPSYADDVASRFFGVGFADLAQAAKECEHLGACDPAVTGGVGVALQRLRETLRRHVAPLEETLPTTVRGSVRDCLGLPPLAPSHRPLGGASTTNSNTKETPDVQRGVLVHQLRDKEQRAALLRRLEAGIRGVPIAADSRRHGAGPNRGPSSRRGSLNASLDGEAAVVAPLAPQAVLVDHLESLVLSLLCGAH